MHEGRSESSAQHFFKFQNKDSNVKIETFIAHMCVSKRSSDR